MAGNGLVEQAHNLAMASMPFAQILVRTRIVLRVLQDGDQVDRCTATGTSRNTFA